MGSEKATVRVRDLSKVYASSTGLLSWFGPSGSGGKSVTALAGVSLDLLPGEVFGLLGPNGAGKTTLIKILATLVLPTDGDIRVLDHDPRRQSLEIRRKVGYVSSDERSFFWRLTGRENLLFFAALHEIPAREAKKRIDFYLDLFSLQRLADRRFGQYSSGRKKLFTIIRGLLPQPPILVLDEPTNSLDPPIAWKLIEYVRHQLAEQEQRTILWATHRLEEIHDVCHRVLLIDKGLVRFCGSVQELSRLARKESTEANDPRGLREVFERLVSD